MIVAKPADPILAPAIGSAPRMVMREIFPSVAVLAVILTHCAPLALAEIRPPASPMHASMYFLEAHRLCGWHSCRVRSCLCCRRHRLGSLRTVRQANTTVRDDQTLSPDGVAVERVDKHRLRAYAGSGHSSRPLRRAYQEAKATIADSCREAGSGCDEAVNRDRKISETDQPEYSVGPSRCNGIRGR